MKLQNLYNSGPRRNKVFLEYVTKLKKLSRGEQVLTEGKRVVVTTEIIDDDEEVKTQAKQQFIDDDEEVKTQAKQQFIEQAQEIGKFSNPEWVKHVVNGLKQAGVQGLNSISESERPVTAGEVRQLIEALIKLISK